MWRKIGWFISNTLSKLFIWRSDVRLAKRVRDLKNKYPGHKPPDEEIVSTYFKDVDMNVLGQTIKITTAFSECSKFYGDEQLYLKWEMGRILGKVFRQEYLNPLEDTLWTLLFNSNTPNATLHQMLLDQGDIKRHQYEYLNAGLRGADLRKWLARTNQSLPEE